MCKISKAVLRKKLLEERRGIPAADARARSESIASLLRAQAFWREAASVFCFISVEGEPDTSPLILGAFAEGKAFYAPRTLKGALMETVPVASEEIYRRAPAEWPRRHGIPEPSAATFPAAKLTPPALVIVPSLAVDRLGFRLGYGGGYYDRFIEQARSAENPPLFAAIQFAAFLSEDPLPRDEHDMRVDVIVTEKEIIIPSCSAPV